MAYRDDFREVQREAWWTAPRILAFVVVGFIVIYGLGFLATGGDLAIYSFWAPKQANAENRVFHNTQAYTDGKITYIGQLCRESATAEGNQKAAIDGEIINESRTIDNSKLPADERECIDRAKGM